MIICIWLLISLTLLAVSLSGLAFSQINFSRFYLDRQFSYYLTRAAVREVSVERENDMTPNYDTLGELRTSRAIDFEGYRGEYYLIDEESKVNINTADSGILSELLDSEYLAQDVIDYRENEHPLLAIEELLGVGLGEELFEEIRGFITVNSNGFININTAPLEVLLVLGCNQDASDKILDFRSSNIFDSQTTISSVFNDLGIDCDYDNLLNTKSSNYTIRTSTYVGNREALSLDVIYNSPERRIESWMPAEKLP
jgi:type II secretory pathway component PulK